MMHVSPSVPQRLNAMKAMEVHANEALVSKLDQAVQASSSAEGLLPGAVCMLARGTPVFLRTSIHMLGRLLVDRPESVHGS